MNSCLICERFSLKPEDVFESKNIQHFFYMWDCNPATPGHLLVVNKRHVADYKNLTDSELQELPKAVLAAYDAVETTDLTKLYTSMLGIFPNPKTQVFLEEAINQLKKFKGKPDGYNHGLNDGKAAGRTLEHFHYHIMPRWNGDMDDPRGGIRHMFDGMGNYYQGMNK